MTFEKLDNLMTGSLQRAGAARSIRAAVVADTLVEVLQQRFGALAGQSRVTRVKDGRATVTCASSVLAEEIRLNEPELLGLVNERFGQTVLSSLRSVA